MKQKVAFIITVYKGDKLTYFQKAIETIVNQDYGFENIHIYLGIDGELPNGIESYINENSKFFYKVIKNENNKGLAFTLNRLIDNLEEEAFVFRMDSDDICYLNRVSKQVSFMNANPKVLISGGAIEEFSETEGVKMIREYPKNILEAKKYIYKASIFAHPAVCFKKDFFNKGFRYDAHHKFSQDVDLWFRALNKNIEIANIKDVVLKLRVQDNFYKQARSPQGSTLTDWRTAASKVARAKESDKGSKVDFYPKFTFENKSLNKNIKKIFNTSENSSAPIKIAWENLEENIIIDFDFLNTQIVFNKKYIFAATF